MSLDLEQHLVFYGSYHANKVNIVIHTICVPLILFSGFCIASYSGTLVHLPSWLSVPYFDLNLGAFAALCYASLYLLLEPVAGFVLAALCLGGAAVGNYFKEQDPEATLKVAIGIHIFSWIAQFVGHGAFEKRAPALMDNLVQAIFLAPMFIWLELLFALGYRPELQARVNTKVQASLAKLRAEKQNGKAN